MPDSRLLLHLNAVALRDAGFTDEADRLDVAVRRARVWRSSASENALALSVFGSVRHDELTAALRLRGVA